MTIDGRAYWDGGFSANPDMLQLAAESPVDDTLLVLLNPISAPATPRSAADIEDRVNTITFNQPLLRDIETIVGAQDARLGWLAGRRSTLGRLKHHRFHLVDAGDHTGQLDAESKVLPDRAQLRHLRAAGRQEADAWLTANTDAVGRRPTVELRARFLSDAQSSEITPEVETDSARLEETEPVGRAA